MKIFPATIASDLQERIQALVERTVHYISPDEIELRRLMAEAQRLINADAFCAYVLQARLWSLTGDHERFRTLIEKALRLSPGSVEAYGQYSSCLSDLGFCSEAQGYFKQANNPQGGNFSKTFSLGFSCGAYHCLASHIDQAEKMQLDLTTLKVDLVRDAIGVLDAASFDDAAVGEMLDLAGEVLREERVFSDTGHLSVLDLESDKPCVHISIRVALPGERVAAMSYNLAEKILDRMETVPDSIHVSFIPR